MRTKALLSAAALAAGALTSMAQVYSANIVGYVNITANPGLYFMSNPLDATPNNSAVNVFNNNNPDQTGNTPGPFDGDNLQIWNGLGFNVLQFDSQTADTTTGFVDTHGTPVPAPTLNSGLGFIYFNGNPQKTVTLVGQVRTGTNNLALPYQNPAFALGSQLPVSGGVSSALGFNNANADQTGNTPGPLDGANVQILQVNGSGFSLGYKVYQFDSQTADTTTGFVDTHGTPVAEPQIPMAGGFFFVNGTGGTYNWSQILNP